MLALDPANTAIQQNISILEKSSGNKPANPPSKGGPASGKPATPKPSAKIVTSKNIVVRT